MERNPSPPSKYIAEIFNPAFEARPITGINQLKSKLGNQGTDASKTIITKLKALHPWLAPFLQGHLPHSLKPFPCE